MSIIGLSMSFFSFLGGVFSDPVATVDTKYLEVGQVWEYKNREGEDDSRIVILKLEKNNGLEIVHISVQHILMKNPRVKNGFSSEIQHLPFSKDSLLKSLITLESSKNSIPDFSEGYNEWKNAKGGVFTISIKDAIDYVEKAMN